MKSDMNSTFRQRAILPLMYCVLLVFVMSTAGAGAVEKYKQVAIVVSDKAMLNRIWSAGIDFEGATGKPGGMMEFVGGEHELQALSDAGIHYDVVIDDLAAHYSQGLVSGSMNALGFGYGSMGGFYTFAEVLRQLDSMQLQYPSLITQRDSIGRTVEGRALWAIKISDNPTINEPAEPEVLYTSLHHAREPEGMMTLLYYMWWLLEHYSSNAEASYLVNNRQMWFIPVVNPDGYVYNQTTNPGGGGMHRKNRRNVGSSNLGVDLNRNYGPMYMWNAANGGSSTNANDDTYRGTAPFSEPETQAIDGFMRVHQFKACLNYHTYGNYLIYPWGYLSRENGDSLTFRDWAYDMTFDNHYTNGTDQQTVSYSTRGNSDDYMFGDTTKPKTYAMTPEVGTTGFWPGSSEILPLAALNLTQNKLLSMFAGQHIRLRNYRIQDVGGNGFPDRGETFDLLATVRNRGLASGANVTVSISSNSSSVQFITPSLVFDSLASQRDSLLAFNGYVDANAVTGVPVQVYLQFSDPEGFLKIDTVQIFLGTPTTAFADSASSGILNWSTGQGWGVTSNAHTLPNAFTDSPVGSYSASANNSLTMNNQINLNGYNYAQLKFWSKWAIEPSWDFGTVEITTNNGTTWTTLRSTLSHSGSGRSGSQQPAGTWGYENYTPGLTWVEQDVDLSTYVNKQIKIRFRLAADGGDQRDGFYVDDVRLYAYTINSALLPVAPLLLSPTNGAVNQPLTATLLWHAASGATGYHFQLATDSLFAGVLVNDSTLVDTLRQISSLTNFSRYFWRVRSRNGSGSGPFTASWNFHTLAPLPSAPALVLPANGTVNQPTVTTLLWNTTSFAEIYRVQIATDSLFGFMVLNDSLLVDTTKQTTSLLIDTTFYWRIQAENVSGAGPWSAVWRFTTTAQKTRQYPFMDGWNMVAVPLTVGDMRKATIYPMALSPAFAFIQGSGYTQKDTLANGVGYWMKFGSAGSISLAGTEITRDTIDLVPGWGLIGGISSTVDTGSVVQIPTGILHSAFFYYHGTYTPTDSLRPGEAYWVKSGGNGRLIITSEAKRRKRTSNTIDQPIPPKDAKKQ